MPRNGSGVYSLPAGSIIPNGQVSDAPSQHNAPLNDLASDANAARPIVAGGTGATSATQARVNLGLQIGADVQAYDAGLQSISGLTTSANQMIYTTAADTYAVTGLTAAGRALLDDANAAAQRTTLGLGSAALLTAGTGANNAVQLDGSGRLPAVDGSQLTNVNGIISATFSAASSVDITIPDDVLVDVTIEVSAASVSDARLQARYLRGATAIDAAGAYQTGRFWLVAGIAGGAGQREDDTSMIFTAVGANAGMNTSPELRLVLRLYRPGTNGVSKTLNAEGVYQNAAGNMTFVAPMASRLLASPATDAVTGLRLFASSGTITGRYSARGIS